MIHRNLLRAAALLLAVFAAAPRAAADSPDAESGDAAAPARTQRAARRPAALGPGAIVPAEALAEKMACTDSRQIAVSDIKGPKGTLIIFTCNHCPFVKAWQERLVALGNSAGEKGIGVVAVNSNDVTVVPGDGIAPMKGLAEAKGYRFPYACDEKARLARALGASRTPEAFLLDAAGKIVYHGAIDDNSESAAGVKSRWLADAIDALVAGREVAVKETKAIGCAIKFPAGAM